MSACCACCICAACASEKRKTTEEDPLPGHQLMDSPTERLQTSNLVNMPWALEVVSKNCMQACTSEGHQSANWNHVNHFPKPHVTHLIVIVSYCVTYCYPFQAQSTRLLRNEQLAERVRPHHGNNQLPCSRRQRRGQHLRLHPSISRPGSCPTLSHPVLPTRWSWWRPSRV